MANQATLYLINDLKLRCLLLCPWGMPSKPKRLSVNMQLRRLITLFKLGQWWAASGKSICGGNKAVIRGKLRKTGNFIYDTRATQLKIMFFQYKPK